MATVRPTTRSSAPERQVPDHVHGRFPAIARKRHCAVETGRDPPCAFRITTYLEHPDTRVEVAHSLAGHAKAETTFLHGRRAETILLDEIERIGI